MLADSRPWLQVERRQSRGSAHDTGGDEGDGSRPEAVIYGLDQPGDLTGRAATGRFSVGLVCYIMATLFT